GSGAVTAGRPKGQRTATPRNARGRRPSWRSTIAMSSIARQGTVGAAPGADPLHDEEPLARLDEREPPGLERERGRARRRRDALLELVLLGLEPVDLPTAAHERVPRVHVCPERPEVEERDQDESADRQPAEEDARSWCTPPARRGPLRHPGRVRSAAAGSSPGTGALDRVDLDHV